MRKSNESTITASKKFIEGCFVGCTPSIKESSLGNSGSSNTEENKKSGYTDTDTVSKKDSLEDFKKEVSKNELASKAWVLFELFYNLLTEYSGIDKKMDDATDEEKFHDFCKRALNFCYGLNKEDLHP